MFDSTYLREHKYKLKTAEEEENEEELNNYNN